MSYEQEMQQSRNLVDNYNKLSEETREKLANGVEWLVFLQNMAATEGEREKTAPETEAVTA